MVANPKPSKERPLNPRGVERAPGLALAQGSGPVTVALIADRTLVRTALRSVLEATNHLEVIGEATSAEAAHLIEQERPAVAVVDAAGRGAGILSSLRDLPGASRTAFVLTTVRRCDCLADDAPDLGISRCLPRASGPGELLDAVTRAAGGLRCDSGGERCALTRGLPGRDPDADPSEAIGLLTVRELQVLKLAAEGMTLSGIALALGISPHTAESHRRRLMSKLGLGNLAELVRAAVRHGLVPLESP